MIITKNGIAIRMNVADLRVMGRATQGVKLINIQENDNIGAVTKVDHEDEELTIDTELNTNVENPEISPLPPEESKE
jgi:DNA gyrase subunit A